MHIMIKTGSRYELRFHRGGKVTVEYRFFRIILVINLSKMTSSELNSGTRVEFS